MVETTWFRFPWFPPLRGREPREPMVPAVPGNQREPREPAILLKKVDFMTREPEPAKCNSITGTTGTGDIVEESRFVILSLPPN